MMGSDEGAPHERHAIESWMALDVGGANIKAAHTRDGAATLPFELWKRPDESEPRPGRPGRHVSPCDRVALTMTAELCDCYPDQSRSGSTRSSTPSPEPSWRPIARLGGRWPVPRRRRRSGGSPTWLRRPTGWRWRPSSPRLMADEVGILIDIGSTTTDLIPLGTAMPRRGGGPTPNVCRPASSSTRGSAGPRSVALATELRFRGTPTGLAAELFASTLDVYLTLGEIPPTPRTYQRPTAAPRRRGRARDRLARMIGTDRDTFTDDDALAFAHAADEALLARLESVAARACRATIGHPRYAVVAGSGDFLARRLAPALIEHPQAILSLDQVWPVASRPGCAHALLMLATENERKAVTA